MSLPLVSVVIPTCGRPQFLPVAVRSALESMDAESEVIVVPNGPDESWKQSLAPLSKDRRIRIEPIRKAHANAARNHGMSLARGKYLRFLDDDDSLLPIAAKQITVLENSNAEMCSGAIDQVNSKNSMIGLMVQRDNSDLVCAMVRPGRVCLPTAHVFLRSAIQDFRWDDSLPWEQDTQWMMQLCATKEWIWQPVPDVVGRWTQHNDPRTSGTISDTQRARYTSDLLLTVLERLQKRSALTAPRSDAFSEALWDFAHLNFFRAPRYWTQIARVAIRLNPDRKPPAPLYQSPIVRHINPLIIEYLLVPTRFLKHYRDTRQIEN